MATKQTKVNVYTKTEIDKLLATNVDNHFISLGTATEKGEALYNKLEDLLINQNKAKLIYFNLEGWFYDNTELNSGDYLAFLQNNSDVCVLYGGCIYSLLGTTITKLTYKKSEIDKLIPSAPKTGNYVLKSVNGVAQWVKE